mgnify:CR=1 FL=1
MKENEILKIYGTDYKELTKLLLTEAELESRIPGKMPGLASSRTWWLPRRLPGERRPTRRLWPVSSNTFKREVLHSFLCWKAPGLGDKTSESAEVCGYLDLCRQYGVPFVDTQKDSFHVHDCKGLELNLCDEAAGLDFLINVPVLKGHCQTKLTCALKNMKG